MMGLTKLSVKSLMKGGKKLFTKLKIRTTLRAVTQKSAYHVFQIILYYVKFNYSWKNATQRKKDWILPKLRGQIHGWISLPKAIKKVLYMFFDPDFIQILSRFYPDFILILSRFKKTNFIQFLSRFYPNFWKKSG